jgi:hypothetical protein
MTESHTQQASITRPTIDHQPERDRDREDPATRTTERGVDLQAEPNEPHDHAADREPMGEPRDRASVSRNPRARWAG